MSDVIKRVYDGNRYQGDSHDTYASDQAETWSGTRDKSIEQISDEYAKYMEAKKERNLKEDIEKPYMQKEHVDFLEENMKLRKINKALIGFLEKECRMCMIGGLKGCKSCLLKDDCERLDMIKKAKGKQS